MKKIRILLSLFLLISSNFLFAAPTNTQLEVWANEAIIATYTFSASNYLARQHEIAKYFTSSGWIAYSTALNDSGLPDVIKKNAYKVTAVATLPPVVTELNPHQWQASMPVLVLYQNSEKQKKQTLMVTINFSETPGHGVRDLSLNNLQSKVSEPFCECQTPIVDTDVTTAPN